MNEHGAGDDPRSAEAAPFHFICPGCGADIDAPDRYFRLGPPALVPHANHALVSAHCLGCQTDHDLALWTVDQQRFVSESGPGLLEAADGAEALALLERYRRLVEQYHLAIDARYELSDRFPAVSMAALAACRGLRLAVATRPGVQPPAVLLLGHYRCVVSFDRTPERPYPYALHASVGNSALPAHLPGVEQHWLLSLFFTPGEMPFLQSEPGQTVPVIHYYLPAYSPELNPCS